jgi:hypothetical protein
MRRKNESIKEGEEIIMFGKKHLNKKVFTHLGKMQFSGKTWCGRDSDKTKTTCYYDDCSCLKCLIEYIEDLHDRIE